MEQRKITKQMITEFESELRNDEKSELTVEKYLRDVRRFIAFSSGDQIDKSLVLAYKAELEKNYAVASEEAETQPGSFRPHREGRHQPGKRDAGPLSHLILKHEHRRTATASRRPDRTLRRRDEFH